MSEKPFTERHKDRWLVGPAAYARPNPFTESPNAFNGSGVPIEGDDVVLQESAPADPDARSKNEAAE